jgi:hypothetical protein
MRGLLVRTTGAGTRSCMNGCTTTCTSTSSGACCALSGSHLISVFAAHVRSSVRVHVSSSVLIWLCAADSLLASSARRSRWRSCFLCLPSSTSRSSRARSVRALLLYHRLAVLHARRLIHGGAAGFFFPVLFFMFGGPGVYFVNLTKSDTRFYNVFLWLMLSVGNALLLVLYSREWFSRYGEHPVQYPVSLRSLLRWRQHGVCLTCLCAGNGRRLDGVGAPFAACVLSELKLVFELMITVYMCCFGV